MCGILGKILHNCSSDHVIKKIAVKGRIVLKIDVPISVLYTHVEQLAPQKRRAK